MNRRRGPVVVVLAVAAVVLAASCVYDQGVLPGDSSSSAQGINHAGEIVGWSSTDAPVFSAFRKDSGGSLVKLPTMAGDTQAQAWGVNDAGSVVGTSWSDTHASPVVWDTAGLVHPVPAPRGQGRAINQGGDVVGDLPQEDAAHETHNRSFLWKAGAASVSVLVLPPGTTDSEVFAVNATDEIVGSAYEPGVGYQGVVWHGTGGTYDLLGYSSPLGINDAGTVVGAVGAQAVMWPAGQTTPQAIPGLSTTLQSGANAINNDGIVVGYGLVAGGSPISTTTTPSTPGATTTTVLGLPPTTAPTTTTTTTGTTGQQHAFAWNPGSAVTTDLGARGANASTGLAINADGDVAGYSGGHAVTFGRVA